MEDLIVNSPSFNTSRILPGYLIIVSNRLGNIVATGVITRVGQLGLKLSVYDAEDNYYSEDGMDNMKPFHVKIEDIVSGELGLFIINPNTYEENISNEPDKNNDKRSEHWT